MAPVDTIERRATDKPRKIIPERRPRDDESCGAQVGINRDNRNLTDEYSRTRLLFPATSSSAGIGEVVSGEDKKDVELSSNDSRPRKLRKRRQQYESSLRSVNDNDFDLCSPLLLDGINDRSRWHSSMDLNVGCVVRVRQQQGVSEDEASTFTRMSDRVTLRSALLPLIEPHVSNHDAVYYFFCRRNDTLKDTLCCIARLLSSSERLVGGQDYSSWLLPYSDYTPLVHFVFLQRLVRPLCLAITNIKDEISLVGKVEFSLLDVILGVEGVTDAVVEALLICVCQLEAVLNEKPACRKYLGDLQSTLLEAIPKSALRSANTVRSMALALNMHKSLRSRLLRLNPDLKIPQRIQVPAGWVQVLHDKVKHHSPKFTFEAVMAAREETIQSFEKQCRQADDGNRRSRRKTVRLGCDANLIHTPDDLSINEFESKTEFLRLVHSTIPRLFLPKISRPIVKCCHMLVDQELLRSVVFDQDGSLKRSAGDDIDMTGRHGYINFSGDQKKPTDFRWQVPFKPSSDTWNSLKKFLDQLIDSKQEVFREIQLLVGGSTDQPLHIDTGRQRTLWKHRQFEQKGWESQRLQYNSAMASDTAPSAAIIALNDEATMYIAVQIDRIVFLGNDKCNIRGSPPSEVYDIVRKSKVLVVIRARPGIMFTGDFPHAGVKNISTGTAEEKLLIKLNNDIQHTLSTTKGGRRMEMNAVRNALYRTVGLNQLCRLHCSTESTTRLLKIPENEVDFYGCRDNLGVVMPAPSVLKEDEELAVLLTQANEGYLTVHD